MRKHPVFLPLLLTLILLLCAAAAPAASINYGNFQNSLIQFNNVTETASNPDPPLFVSGGNASNVFLGGSTIVFDVDPNFFAETTLATEVTVDSTLTLDIVIPNGSNLRIKEVIITESGDYNLSNDGEAQVITNLEWRVTGINHAVNLSLPGVQQTMSFAPAGSGPNAPTGHYKAPVDTAGQWSGSLTAQVDALTLGATAIEIFTVNNELDAVSFDGGSNRIQKKQFSIEVVFVPEPGTFAMLALGLAGLTYQGRRRRS